MKLSVVGLQIMVLASSSLAAESSNNSSSSEPGQAAIEKKASQKPSQTVVGTADCPPEDRMPSCINCGGDDGTQKCLGLTEFNNLWKGCDCVPSSEPDCLYGVGEIWKQPRELYYIAPAEHSKALEKQPIMDKKTE